MRLYAAISKVEAQDDGTVKVEGIASSEAVDDVGETILASAMKAAIPDYMKFPALREMHQLSAAGTTLEADVGTDGVTRIVAHVVDPIAVSKVKNQVYRGFSVGGQVTQRDTADRKIITGLKLNEISLVDRPANPEAVLDCWKAASTSIEGAPGMEGGLATLGDTAAGQTLAALLKAGPAQVWTCGISDHQHTAKAEAAKCLEKQAADAAAEAEALTKQAATEKEAAEAELAISAATAVAVPEVVEISDTSTALDVAQKAQAAAEAALAKADDKKPDGDYGDVTYADPGYQDDKKPRYPVDTEEHIRAAWSYINKEKNQDKYSSEQVGHIKAKIVAAWKDKIDKDGPPSAEKASPAEISKALMDVGHIASIILDLDWLSDVLNYESVLEGDDSAVPAQIRALVASLCAALNALVAEETAEIMSDSEIGEGMPLGGMDAVARSAIVTSLQKTITDTTTLEALVSAVQKAGAKHNASDQAHLDLAAHCTKTMMSMDGPSRGDKVLLAQAQGHIMAASGVGSAAAGGDDGAGKPGINTGATSVAGPGSEARQPNATQDTGHAGATSVPQGSGGAVPASPFPKASDSSLLDDCLAKAYTGLVAAKVPGRDIAELMAGVDTALKAGVKPHQVLMDTAHKCLQRVSDGATCKEDAEKPARHSGETMAHLDSAHFHLTKMDGCKCMAAGNELPGGDPMTGKTAGATTAPTAPVQVIAAAEVAIITQADLDAAVTKAVAEAIVGKAAENLELAKTVVGMAATLDRMSGRVEAIYNQPMPAQAVARATLGTSITKAVDNGGGSEVSATNIVDALAAMSPQDQTLAMIKAAQRKPDARIAAVATHEQYRPVR